VKWAARIDREPVWERGAGSGIVHSGEIIAQTLPVWRNCFVCHVDSMPDRLLSFPDETKFFILQSNISQACDGRDILAGRYSP
jgi:diadenosine tetraphosphatase ApaH/serine/threonine PP2A family protein phosphatase